MATFLKDSDLNSVLENIFESAEKYLILISPYIKLHDRLASILRDKKDNPNLEITIVFGKNEEDFSKSLREEDFNFFKEFPNIEIRYEKRLHAKYYANQDAAILTSMNLYNYSQDNNIEAGILTVSKGLLGDLTGQNSLDNETGEYFQRVIDQSDLLFAKYSTFEPTMLGISKRYTHSEIKKDTLSDYFNNKNKTGSFKKTETSFHAPAKQLSGYCIRTGVQIPFDPKHPMSNNAFQNWKKYSNPDYPEKFCHFSGEPSNGETSYSKPILRKNWAKAKELHKV